MEANKPAANGIRVSLLLVAACVTCATIIWAGGKFAGFALSTLAVTSPAAGETIASATIFGLLLIAGILGGKLSGVNAGQLGPNSFARLAQGVLIGLGGLLIAATFAAIAGVLRPAGGATSVGFLMWGSALIVLQSGSEEVFFRGWLQQVLVKGWGPFGIVVAALAFAALHMVGSVRDAISFANLFLGGLMFGLLATRYQGLGAAIGAHFAWNWAEQLLVGLDPNPGVGTFGSIWDADLVGKSWWGGSGEGLNASIAMTFALAILLAPLIIVPANDRRPLALRRSGHVPA